jgi:hypothetical protein
MDRLKETLYDVLGVSRDAKVNDIGRAYNKHMAAMRKETTPPDARRNALLHEAYEVLMDEQKRAAYDKSIRADAVLMRAAKKPVSAAAAIVALTFLATGATIVYFIVNRPAVGKPPRLLSEIQASATLALGRVQSIDVSGKDRPVGMAFTLEEGVMVTPCAGIKPDSELVVVMAPRRIPARLGSADAEKRFCRLEVERAGSWPMMVRSAPPSTGEKIYAPELAANGEVTLREGSVKRVDEQPRGRVIVASVGVAPANSGQPLLDVDGRVVGVAMVGDDGKARHVGVPVEWIEAGKPKAKALPPTEPEPEATEKKPPVAKDLHDPRANISPERRERLEKAFRPPPTVPDDI